MENIMVTLMNKVITLHKKKTSMRLTDLEWNIFNILCKHEKIKRRFLLESICSNRSTELNLTSAVRLFMLLYFFERFPSIECAEKKRRDILHRALRELN